MENKDCPCKRTKCKRHGNCDACREHHQLSKHQSFPACERIEAKKERKEARKERKNRRKKVPRMNTEKWVLSDAKNLTGFIRKLRMKIEPDPQSPKYILTVWGVGYKFNEEKP
ncbi:helix-turn-helix domain-containing protein [Kineothrix sp. MB12-C1]|nr:helix-turn-helix domain-containing protein [Kineothrix sp. MB12-C1]WMC91071.1 helix-turn-helix domain-containing protein [Kineothrix sp. MB12-C1]